MRRVLAIIGTLVFTACATQSAQRTAAERLAGQVSQMQADLSAMADARTNIAIARDHVTERLLHSALDAENNNEERKQGLNTGQRQMFDNAIKSAEAAKTRRAKADAEMLAAETLAKAETSRIDTHAEDFAAAAKSLGRLAETPNWKEQLSFYVDFFREVKKSLDDMDQQTKQSETDVASNAAQQAKEAADTKKTTENMK